MKKSRLNLSTKVVDKQALKRLYDFKIKAFGDWLKFIQIAYSKKFAKQIVSQILS
jgi:hypothetical protein